MTAQVFRLAFAATMMIPTAGAAIVDLRTHRVPDVLVSLALVPTALVVMVDAHPTHRLVAVAAGSCLLALPVLFVHLLAPTSMGFGDVKLAAALGAALGVLAPELAVPALAAAAGLTLVVACCRRRVAVSFAPGLVLGAVAALAIGSFEGWRVAA